MSEWKPIETAPPLDWIEDGLHYHLLWNGSRVFMGYYDERRRVWMDQLTQPRSPAYPQPTHWMPEPAPPNSQAEDARLTQADVGIPISEGKSRC